MRGTLAASRLFTVVETLSAVPSMLLSLGRGLAAFWSPVASQPQPIPYYCYHPALTTVAVQIRNVYAALAPNLALADTSNPT